MSNSYDKGDLLRVAAEFTDDDDVVQDPAQVYAAVRLPSGVVTTLHYGVDAALVKASTGVYYVDIDCATTGTYKYRFYSTGNGQAAAESTFFVRRSELD